MAFDDKVSLIVSLGLAATALLRRRSAAVRHWVLAVTIACAAATPLLELVVPSWHVPVGARWLGRSAEPLTLLIPIRLAQSDDAAGAASNAAASPARPVTAARALGMIWMAGAAVSLLLLLVGLARLAWLASGSPRVEHGTWTDLTARLSRDYGLRRPVLLLQSRHPTLLATWGAAAAEGHPAAGGLRLARGPGPHCARPRAGACPAPRLARASRRRAAPLGVLVQPARVDRRQAAAPGKRAGVRRCRARPRSERPGIRHSLIGSRACVQRVRSHRVSCASHGASVQS